MSDKKVVICYSHRDEPWKELLIKQLGALEAEVWDDRRIAPGEKGLPEFTQSIERARVAILIVSADFLATGFVLGKEIPRLLQSRQIEGLRVIFLIARPCAWQHLKWLNATEARPPEGRPLSRGAPEQIDADLEALADEVAAAVRRSRKRLSTTESVSLSRLPYTSLQLFGREPELAALDEAWDNPRTNLVQVAATGGSGKTALANVWLNRMAEQRWRGAERVFGWSFYVQGAALGRETAADLFIATALRWFGDPDPNLGSPWDKGERLAELIRGQRTLLVIDGLEPLQHPPGGALGGRVKDPALESLLRELARDNSGLCVVTTRLAVEDLKDFVARGLQSMDLEQLGPEEGAQYLDWLGVKGSSKELRLTSRELGGHALTLTLLGTHLVIGYGGEVRWRTLVPGLQTQTLHGGHARAVMQAYTRWFEGRPEGQLLWLMGLFDRPAEAGAVQALREPAAIDGLTDRLQDLSDSQWLSALDTLRRARLVEPQNPQQPATLDCHPLVREYFGEQLQSASPDGWREANARLFLYYKEQAPELPETLEEMAPLYAAIAHACQGDHHEEAFRDIYLKRIQRGDEYFSRNQLVAFGAELAALASFFNPPWENPVGGLGDMFTGFLLNDTGYALRALGRLGEAIHPLKAALASAVPMRRWVLGAVAASNLSELHLALGEIGKAIATAERSVELSDRSGDAFQRLTRRTMLADILHQAGRIAEAERLFEQAEQVQRDDQPELPLLYSLTGYRYCDLLLAQGRTADVRERASRTLKIAEDNDWVVDAGLDHLSLGRASLGEGDLAEAESHLDEAIRGLRQGGEQHFLPRALLARAEVHRLRSDFTRARSDLDEALLVAARCGMRLHEADCRLEQARLSLAAGNRDAAKASHAAARKLVEETGYHRRDQEVAALAEQLRDL